MSEEGAEEDEEEYTKVVKLHVAQGVQQYKQEGKTTTASASK